MKNIFRAISVAKNPIVTQAKEMAREISRDMEIKIVGGKIIGTYKPIKNRYGVFQQGIQFSPTSSNGMMLEHIVLHEGQVFSYGEAHHIFSKQAVPHIRAETIEVFKDILNANEEVMDRMEFRI